MSCNYLLETLLLVDGQSVKGNYFPLFKTKRYFQLVGIIYGGDGRTTFALPDLRGRTAVGPGLMDKQLGARYGSEHVTLDVPQLPSHSHTA